MEELKVLDWTACLDREEKRKEDRIKIINWDVLVAIDSYLDKILFEIERLDPMDYQQARELWKHNYKEKLFFRVGTSAPGYAPEIMKTSEAYSIVYRKWYDELMKKSVLSHLSQKKGVVTDFVTT